MRPTPDATVFRLLLAAAVVLCAHDSPAQNPLSELRPDECAKYEHVPIPSGDLPTDADRQRLKSCKSADLYFGFDGNANPADARLCAYIEREQGKQEPEAVFGGTGLLTMIYANGKGAARNFDLALKFSCHSGWAPAENLGRFRHLQRLKAAHWKGTSFSLCDDITSGFMMGWCAGLQEQFAKQKRARRLNAITANWSDADKSEFSRLQQAANAFFEARMQNEVDLSGTARAEFQIEEGALLKNDFVTSLERFEKGILPSASAALFARSDARLNAAYKKIQSHPPDFEQYGTVTPAGIKVVQRTWLTYRDAWVAFGKQRYPKVAESSWKAWITDKRTRMLKDLMQ